MTEIMEISAIDTYLVRNAVLRKGKSIESCLFAGDELPTTHHFGVFCPHLIGTVSLFESGSPYFEDDFQIQVRGMAIMEDYQGQNLGEQLIEYCEGYLRQTKKQPLLWFNARETAADFYEKLGYQVMGNSFDIEGIGKHVVMYKKLSA